jgi:hypothetical protein
MYDGLYSGERTREVHRLSVLSPGDFVPRPSLHGRSRDPAAPLRSRGSLAALTRADAISSQALSSRFEIRGLEPQPGTENRELGTSPAAAFSGVLIAHQLATGKCLAFGWTEDDGFCGFRNVACRFVKMPANRLSYFATGLACAAKVRVIGCPSTPIKPPSLPPVVIRTAPPSPARTTTARSASSGMR